MFIDVVEWVSSADDDALDGELRRIEALSREIAASRSAVLAEMERRELHRVDGHSTMWGLLRSKLHWSDGDCKVAMRLARHVAEHPEIGESLYETWMSEANANALALAATRVGLADLDDVVAEREFAELAREAERCEFDDLRTKARQFEQRIASRAERDEADDAHQCRSATVHVGDVGGELVAHLGPVEAAEVAEIFGQYVDAEWRTDWDAAVAEHGDEATALLLPRSHKQRSADALVQIFRDAASTPPGSRAPEPVVNIHVDHDTFTDILVEAELLPERTVDPFDDPTPHVTQRMARTERGQALDHGTILRLLLDGYVRMVIRDDRGVPIRWGRTRRLFTGASRDAVRSLSTRCTQPGCRAPVSVCEIDHTIEFSKGGLTDPDNGNARCKRHNLLKNKGYTVWRDRQGRFHTFRPDGTEVS